MQCSMLAQFLTVSSAECHTPYGQLLEVSKHGPEMPGSLAEGMGSLDFIARLVALARGKPFHVLF